MHESVLLYDGVCGLCDGVVQFTLAHDANGTLKFAPLQGAYAQELLGRHPELAGVDSLIVVERDSDSATERVRVRSDAALYLAQYLGGAWSLIGAILRVVPRFVRDGGYNFVARVRYRVFGKRDACRVPTAVQKARFFD
jgi:predicted DCC family thiol-disulfide oxidoreductase YuxK